MVPTGTRIGIVCGVLSAGAVLLYLPAILNDYNRNVITGMTVGSKSLDDGVRSTSFWLALVVGASISLPTGFDIILDCFWRIRETKAPPIKQTVLQGQVVVWRRLPMLIFSVPYMFMAAFRIAPRYVIATLMLQRMLGSVLILAILQCDDLEIWTGSRVRWLIVVTIVHEVLSFYCAIAEPTMATTIYVLYAASVLVAVYGSSLFLWYSYKWFKKSRWNDRTPEQQLCLVFMGLAVFHAVSILAIHGADASYSQWNNDGEQTLVAFVVFEGIVVIVAYVMPGRIAELQLNSSTMELSVKGKFVRYMVHEIRNPTAIVMTGVEILLEKFETLKFQLESTSQSTDLYNSIMETLHQVQSANVIATEVLNDFLVFDKLKSRMLTIEPTLVDTFYFIDTSTRPFYLPAAQRGIDLSCNVDLSLALVQILRASKLYVDASKIGQVMRNLLSNAMKFSKRGGIIRVTTEVIAFREHDPLASDENIIKLDELIDFDGLQYACLSYLRISVVDCGAGISKENQLKLFQEYMQISPGSLQDGGGSGLGLSIAKCIVEKHAGFIGVYSEGEGKGSTFYIDMPLFQDYEPPAAEGPPVVDEKESHGQSPVGIRGGLRESISRIQSICGQKLSSMVSSHSGLFLAAPEANSNTILRGASVSPSPGSPGSRAGFGSEVRVGARSCAHVSADISYDMIDKYDLSAVVPGKEVLPLPNGVARDVAVVPEDKPARSGTNALTHRGSGASKERSTPRSFISSDSVGPADGTMMTMMASAVRRTTLVAALRRSVAPLESGGEDSTTTGLTQAQRHKSLPPISSGSPRLGKGCKSVPEDESFRSCSVVDRTGTSHQPARHTWDGNLTSMRILIVDDCPLTRKMLKNFLRTKNPSLVIEECADGPSAISLVEYRAGEPVVQEKESMFMSNIPDHLGTTSVSSSVLPRDLSDKFLIAGVGNQYSNLFSSNAMQHDVEEGGAGLSFAWTCKESEQTRSPPSAPACMSTSTVASKSPLVQPYGCVLMDYSMPVMSGPETIRHLRRIGYMGVIVGVTGYQSDEAMKIFKDSGADDVVVKPLKYDVLVEILERYRVNNAAAEVRHIS